MKKKYTRKQILESIKYWEKKLNDMNISEGIRFDGGIDTVSNENEICEEVARYILMIITNSQLRRQNDESKEIVVTDDVAMPSNNDYFVSPVIHILQEVDSGIIDDSPLLNMLELKYDNYGEFGADESGENVGVCPQFDKLFIKKCAEKLRGHVGIKSRFKENVIFVKQGTRFEFDFRLHDIETSRDWYSNVLFSFLVEFKKNDGRNGLRTFWFQGGEDSYGVRKSIRSNAFRKNLKKPNFPQES